MQIWFLRIYTFLAAFLIFQLEMIVTKYFLPWYGGSYAVWGACVTFFQLALLLGYIFAQGVLKKWGIWRYRYAHLFLIFLPFLFFPGKTLSVYTTQGNLSLGIAVFVQLTLNIGLVFLVLSMTNILAQVWLAESELKEGHNPHVLFSVSNLGSFAALLSYPFIFEMFLDLNQQIVFWRVGYVCFIVLHGVLIGTLKGKRAEDVPENELVDEQPVRFQSARWLIFSAAGVVLFLGVTNIITIRLFPIPLLWIIPLSIYLLTFTLNFKTRPWCPRWIINNIAMVIGAGILLYYLTERMALSLGNMVWCLFTVLFLLCMYCQYQLHALKPKNHKFLTRYYVFISLGGFLGGMFVSWIVPLASVSLIEYLFGIFLICLGMGLGGTQKAYRFKEAGVIAVMLVILYFWPAIFPAMVWWQVLTGILLFVLICAQLKTSARAMLILMSIIIAFNSVLEHQWRIADFKYKNRNMYGIIEVIDIEHSQIFLHNRVMHGMQKIHPQVSNAPMGYYHPETVMGQLLTQKKEWFEDIAVIGLGPGIIAAYFDEEQRVDHYELDREVYDVADKYFTFLKRSTSANQFIIGDARLKIKGSAPGAYDLIIVDAFSGGSMPVHLLTVEAIEEYLKHLDQEGLVLFHISNDYLRIGPVLAANANRLGLNAAWNLNPHHMEKDIFKSTWVAMSKDKPTINALITDLDWKEVDQRRAAAFRPWTDSYSNVLKILKVKELWRKKD